jgi:hypothetical protein
VELSFYAVSRKSIASVRTFLPQVTEIINFEVLTVSGKITPLCTALLCHVLFTFNIDLFMYLFIYFKTVRKSDYTHIGSNVLKISK